MHSMSNCDECYGEKYNETGKEASCLRRKEAKGLDIIVLKVNVPKFRVSPCKVLCQERYFLSKDLRTAHSSTSEAHHPVIITNIL